MKAWVWGVAAVSLVAAVVLLWPTSGADRTTPDAPAQVPPPSGRTATALRPQPPAPPASAAPVVLPTQVAPAPAASDPFRAFLEAHRDGAAPAAPQPPLPAPVDPFKAAIDAGRRPEPVPLVSPFGSKQ